MPIRDDSSGSNGTWNNDDLSWLDYIKANASDGGNALSNLGRNLVDGFSPIGTSEQGNMALQVPPIISGIADSYGRLAGTPNNHGNAYNLSGVPELDAPIQQDMSNVLLSLYGGNAVAGMAKRPTDAAVLDNATPPLLGRINKPTARQFDNPASHLPMDPESRLARAQEQGYDVDNIYWHGSPSDPFDAFDGNRFGERDSFWGDGVYADGSANGERTARSHTYSPDMHNQFADWNQGHYRALVSRSENPFQMEQGWPENIQSVFPEYRQTPGPGVYANQTKAFRQALLDNGYDSIRSLDRSHDVFLRPEQLRDVNAVFDPAHVGENGLLLSDNRPSPLGSALATGGEVNQTPVRAYKGGRTSNAAGEPFTSIESALGPWSGFYSSDPAVASRFTAPNYHSNDGIFPVDITMQNPHVIDANGKYAAQFQFHDYANGPPPADPRFKGAPWSQEWMDMILDHNKDGIILKNTADEGDVYIPTRRGSVKSATTGETLFSRGVPLPPQQDDQLPDWLRF